jgi:Protein of unknown function (DUF4065)
MEFDHAKFKSLVLYIIWRTGDQRDFSPTKLNKVLWYSDARAHEALGEPITGEIYTRQKFGPVARHIDPVLDELRREGLIQSSTQPYFDFEVTRHRAHQPPDMSAFGPEELGFIDWWIEHVDEDQAPASTGERSPSHGWRIAALGEELPFHAFLTKRIRQPNSGEELDWARDAAGLVVSK